MQRPDYLTPVACFRRNSPENRGSARSVTLLLAGVLGVLLLASCSSAEASGSPAVHSSIDICALAFDADSPLQGVLGSCAENHREVQFDLDGDGSVDVEATIQPEVGAVQVRNDYGIVTCAQPNPDLQCSVMDVYSDAHPFTLTYGSDETLTVEPTPAYVVAESTPTPSEQSMPEQPLNSAPVVGNEVYPQTTTKTTTIQCGENVYIGEPGEGFSQFWLSCLYPTSNDTEVLVHGVDRRGLTVGENWIFDYGRVGGLYRKVRPSEYYSDNFVGAPWIPLTNGQTLTLPTVQNSDATFRITASLAPGYQRPSVTLPFPIETVPVQVDNNGVPYLDPVDMGRYTSSTGWYFGILPESIQECAADGIAPTLPWVMVEGEEIRLFPELLLRGLLGFTTITDARGSLVQGGNIAFEQLNLGTAIHWGENKSVVVNTCMVPRRSGDTMSPETVTGYVVVDTAVLREYYTTTFP